MLKIFEQCEEKFFLKYIEKLSIPQKTKLFEKGKKIHALANYYLKGENITKLEKALTTEEKNLWESLKSNKYFQLNVINTEYNLLCKSGKYWVGGRLDALMNEGENYFILDYKTGSIPADAQEDFQTIIYLLSADKFLNKKGGYKSLKFVYLGLKTNSEKEITLNPNLKREYEEKIIKMCNKIDFAINSNNFLMNNKHCNTCEYENFCKSAKFN